MNTSLLNWRKRALVLATCAGIGAFSVAAPTALAEGTDDLPKTNVLNAGNLAESTQADAAAQQGEAAVPVRDLSEVQAQDLARSKAVPVQKEAPVASALDKTSQAAPADSQAQQHVKSAEKPLILGSEDYSLVFGKVHNTTKGSVSVQGLDEILASNAADSAEITASMNFNGQVTRKVTQNLDLAQLKAKGNTFSFDFGDYGLFDVSTRFIKNGQYVSPLLPTQVAVTADHYTISAFNGTMPGVYFSLRLFGEDSLRKEGPVYVLFERAGIWDWDALPGAEGGKYGVRPIPSVEHDMLSYQPATVPEQSALFLQRAKVLKEYVNQLHALNANSTFDFWFGDNFNFFVHSLVYQNHIPKDKYKVTLVSDGSLTYKLVNDVFNQPNNTARSEEMKNTWASAMEEEYRTGLAHPTFATPFSSVAYPWAAVQADDNITWSVTRKKLFQTSSDNNALAEIIKAHPRVTQFSVGNLLKQNVKGNVASEQLFKRLLNFNDNLFDNAETAQKKIMVLLGTWVVNERDFADYTRITQAFYGNDYVYYYKGHPATPTDMYPSKQEEERQLSLHDLDASLPAEFILFFNPSINLSGYMSTTFSSVPPAQDRGIWNLSKADGLKSEDTKYMDFYATPLTETADPEILALRKPNHRYFLVELSDALISERGADFALWDSNDRTLNFYKRNAQGQYERVGERNIPSFTDQSDQRLAEGDYVIQSLVDSNRVLDVAGGAHENGTNVWSWEYNGSDAQIWHLSYDASGFAHLRNKKTGKSLDAFGGIGQNGTNINQWETNTSKAQQWRLVFGADGSARLVSATNNNLVLDVSGASAALGANVQLWENNNTAAQRWRFLALKPSFDMSKQYQLEEGYYKISATANSRLVLDLMNWSKENNARFALWSDNGGENQLFKVSKTKDGFYRLESAWSGKALDSAFASPMPGSPILQWDSVASKDNQKWYLEGKDRNKLSLINVGTGLTLDIMGGQMSEGSLIHGYTRNHSKAQDFRFTKVANPQESLDALARMHTRLISDGIYTISAAEAPGLVLDVNHASHNLGERVQLWENHGQANQQWKITHDEQGYLEFENIESGLVLDVQGGLRTPGAAVHQWKRNGTRAQKWIALLNADKSISLVSALSPSLQLDIPAGQMTSGNGLHLWSKNDSSAQRFILRKLDDRA